MRKINAVISILIVLVSLILFLFLGSVNCSPYIEDRIIAENEQGTFNYDMILNRLIVDNSSYPNHKIMLDEKEIKQRFS